MNNSETFYFEEDYQKELNRIYRELGYENIQRIHGKKNKHYDLVLSKNGKNAKIEEKGLTYYHRDCPIELIQNIFPFDLGWFYYTKADYIHFFYYIDMQPYILYQLSLPRLKKKLSKFFKEGKVKPRLALKNYGITINICISWQYLIKENCAVILKKWNNLNKDLKDARR